LMVENFDFEDWALRIKDDLFPERNVEEELNHLLDKLNRNGNLSSKDKKRLIKLARIRRKGKSK